MGTNFFRTVIVLEKPVIPVGKSQKIVPDRETAVALKPSRLVLHSFWLSVFCKFRHYITYMVTSKRCFYTIGKRNHLFINFSQLLYWTSQCLQDAIHRR